MAQSHVLTGAASPEVSLTIRRIDLADLKDALRQGWSDFTAMPSHAIFLCVIYPIIGILLAQFIFGYAMLYFLFPLVAGFALVGPFAAIGLYELSRRREAGLEADATHALDVLHSPSIGAILALGLLLMAIFVIWLATAHAIYVANFGYAQPASLGDFARDVLTTAAGWRMIVIGNVVGFVFAVVVLAISAVSFPLLLDREVGAATALATSVRVIAENPATMAMWGLMVAVLLALGSLPFLLGLAVVVPVLGHATWHLYRRVIDGGEAPRAEFRNPEKPRRFAADFPSSLFR